MTPPSFAQPYQIKLHIGPAGLWSATTTGDVPVAFYYGANGNNLGSRIVIQAQTTVGAYASIGCSMVKSKACSPGSPSIRTTCGSRSSTRGLAAT